MTYNKPAIPKGKRCICITAFSRALITSALRECGVTSGLGKWTNKSLVHASIW